MNTTSGTITSVDFCSDDAVGRVDLLSVGMHGTRTPDLGLSRCLARKINGELALPCDRYTDDRAQGSSSRLSAAANHLEGEELRLLTGREVVVGREQQDLCSVAPLADRHRFDIVGRKPNAVQIQNLGLQDRR